MDILFAAGLFAVSTLCFTLLGLAVRHPASPRFLRLDVFQSLATVAASGAWFFALAFGLRALIGTPLSAQLGPIIGAVSILAILAAALWILHPVRRLRSYEHASQAAANVTPFPNPPATNPGLRSTGRRAA